jgi:hypothetical protein
LDQTLSETDQINLDIRKILDVSTVPWGVEVTLVELKDIQLKERAPDISGIVRRLSACAGTSPGREGIRAPTHELGRG